jgi:hypothetical protein
MFPIVTAAFLSQAYSFVAKNVRGRPSPYYIAAQSSFVQLTLPTFSGGTRVQPEIVDLPCSLFSCPLGISR